MEGAQLSDFYYNRTFMSNVRSKMEMGLSVRRIVWSQSILSISGFLISFMAEKPETNLFFIFRTV